MSSKTRPTIADALKMPARARKGAFKVYLPPPNGAALDACAAAYVWLSSTGVTEVEIAEPPAAEFNVMDGEAAFGLPGALPRGASVSFGGYQGREGSATAAALSALPEEARGRYARLSEALSLARPRRREWVGLDAVWDAMTVWQADPEQLADAYFRMWAVLGALCDGEAERASTLQALMESKDSVVDSRGSGPGAIALLGEDIPPSELELLCGQYVFCVVPRRGGGCSVESRPGTRPGTLRPFAGYFGELAREVAGGRALSFGRACRADEVFEKLAQWVFPAPGDVLTPMVSVSVPQAPRVYPDAIRQEPREPRRQVNTFLPTPEEAPPRDAREGKRSKKENRGAKKPSGEKLSGFGGLANYDFD
jgi:hypothetical protein